MSFHSFAPTLGSLEALDPKTLEYIELVLNFVAPFVNFYFLCFLRRPFFHLNLRIILANLSIGLICMTSTQTIMFFTAPSFEAPNIVVMLLHHSSVILIMGATFWMAMERVGATLFVQRYERNRLWYISFAVCLTAWGLNTFLAYYLLWRVECRIRSKSAMEDLELQLGDALLPVDKKIAKFFQQNSDLRSCFSTATLNLDSEITATLIALLAINLLGVLIFVLIRRHNIRKWKEDLRKKLSHRYQIMENIRTSQQLLKVVVADFVIALYFFAVLQYSLSVARGKPTLLHQVLLMLFDLVGAATATLLPLLFIMTHPRMMSTAKSHFCRKMNRVTASSREQTLETKQAEANVYFTHLQNSWK